MLLFRPNLAGIAPIGKLQSSRHKKQSPVDAVRTTIRECMLVAIVLHANREHAFFFSGRAKKVRKGQQECYPNLSPKHANATNPTSRPPRPGCSMPSSLLRLRSLDPWRSPLLKNILDVLSKQKAPNLNEPDASRGVSSKMKQKQDGLL